MIVDFDGTLAPIVADPPAAAPLPGAAAVLTRLARCVGTVAVVSGRPVAFLRERPAGRRAGRCAASTASNGFDGDDGVDAARRRRPGSSAVRGRGDEADAVAPRPARGTQGRPGRGAPLAPAPRTRGGGARTSAAGWPPPTVSGSNRAASPRAAPAARRRQGHRHRRAGGRRARRAGHRRRPRRRGRLRRRRTSRGARAASAHALRVAVRSPETPAELLRHADLEVDGAAGALDLLTRLVVLLEARAALPGL